MIISDKNFTEKLNNVVQKAFDDVYSLRTRELNDKLDDVKKQLSEINSAVNDVRSLLYALVGANTNPAGPVANRDQLLRSYGNQLDSMVGGVVESLPEPPAALTGRPSGTTKPNR